MYSLAIVSGFGHSGLRLWALTVLTCCFLIMLCLLYDKINNCLRTKRHANSHISIRSYTGGERRRGPGGHEEFALE